MAALARVLANDGRGEPESRLLWAAGKDTLMACFHIGVYSDKELVGQGLCEEIRGGSIPQNRNWELRFLQRNRFIYFIRTPIEP